MIIFCTSWMGYQASGKLTIRKLFLEQYLRFLNFTKIQIGYAAITPIKIVQKYKSYGEFQKFLSLIKENTKKDEAFKESFKRTLLKTKDEFGLEESDASTILEFSEKLGTSDVESQMKHCDLHINLANKFLEEAKQKRKQMAKIYIVIGISSGAMLSLLLL